MLEIHIFGICAPAFFLFGKKSQSGSFHESLVRCTRRSVIEWPQRLGEQLYNDHSPGRLEIHLEGMGPQVSMDHPPSVCACDAEGLL